jgi:hypothetical protein
MISTLHLLTYLLTYLLTGHLFLQQIGTLEDYYHFEHPTHPTRSRRSAVEMTDLLHTHPHVSQLL